MIHEQTATPVIINSRHLASLSRHFPASVLSQEPREESTPLSLALREDRTSQQTLERRQFDEDEKFEQQLLQSAGLWNLLTSPLTAEKQLPTVISPLEDAEPPCDACGCTSSLGFISFKASYCIKSESKSLLERRAKNRSAPKPNSLDSEVYVPQKTNAKKKMKQGFDTDDALQLFLWGPETKQLLTANEEAELITHIQVSCFTYSLSGEGKAKLESQNGCEPTLGEWAEAMGLSGPLLKSEIHRGRSSRERLITANLRLVVHIAKQYQNCGLNFQDLLLHGANEECREVQTTIRMQIRNLRLLVDSTIHKKVYFSKLQDNPFADCTGTHLGAVSRTGFARGKGTAGKRPQHMCREPGTA
ncbi:hypothetical protein DY000_02001983 [Brassica cretica]|uniref:Uncharacterized protein n=1 Tax=Brassica cretica TaxID=69181 RepID=A0ABQ7CHK3_BRACR|nr:hypothetical protein DY000_02001983 [Brassica cretica]